MMAKDRVVGFRLTIEQLNRAQAIAKRLKVSRNRLIGLMINSVEVDNGQSVGINLGQNKSAIPTVQAENGAFAVEN